MVVLTIIIVITGVILSSQSTFNKTLMLANTAYDVALTLRSAETYGIGNRALGSVVNTGYGLHFQDTASFILFADRYPSPSTSSVCHPTTDATSPSALPGNCAYDGDQSELVSTYELGNKVTVSDFCAQTAGSWSCKSSGALSSLDIVFSRPNPAPFISSNGLYSAAFPATGACITLASSQGGTRHISLAASGQISANAASCP